MKNSATLFYRTIRAIILLVFCVATQYAAAQQSENTYFYGQFSGTPTLINGVTVSATVTGGAALNIGNTANNVSCMTGFATGASNYCVRIGDGYTNGSVTYTFSKPVNEVIFSLTDFNTATEQINITVDGGLAFSILPTAARCAATSTGAFVKGYLTTTEPGPGGMEFRIRSTKPYTTVTMTSVNTSGATGVKAFLCSSSVRETPNFANQFSGRVCPDQTYNLATAALATPVPAGAVMQWFKEDMTTPVTDLNVERGCYYARYLYSPGLSAFTLFRVYFDKDCDGVSDGATALSPLTMDLDSDNDGILNAAEMYGNVTGLPQAADALPTPPVPAPAGSNKKQLLFFDWGEKFLSDLPSASTTVNGVKYTATVTQFSAAAVTGTFKGRDANTWSGSRFQYLYNLAGVNEGFYSTTPFVGTMRCRVNVSAVTVADGKPYKYPLEIAAIDMEETAGNEFLKFVTNGDPFTLMESTGTPSNVTSAGRGLTFTSSVNGNSIYTSKNASFVDVEVSTPGGLQGFAVALRLPVDTDNDGIPDVYDLDSDADGTPDAIEGGDNVTRAQLNADGSINTAANGGLGATAGTDLGVPKLVNPSGAADTNGAVGQTLNTARNPALGGDRDGDGIVDENDLDNDNDGILDSAEMYCDQNSANMTTQGASVTNRGQYVFFNWLNTAMTNATTSTITYKGIKYTASISNIGGGATNLYGTDLASIAWGGSPSNLLSSQLNENNKNEALYPSQYEPGTKTFDVTITAVNASTNVPLTYPIEVVVFDAEGTGGTERITYTTNGTAFSEIEKFGTAATSAVVTGANTNTITFFNTELNNTYPVFSTKGSNLVIGTTIQYTTTGTGTSKQGVAYAIRAYCDMDNDGIPNHLDLDSDNDGCPDAIEGDENVTSAHLIATGANAGAINTVATGGVNANGVPNLVNSGGAADIGGDVGQGVGASQTKSLIVNTTYALTRNAAGTGVCSGGTGSIQMAGSQVGVSYRLQTAAGVNVGNVVNGTGNPVFFNHPAITAATTYKVAIITPTDAQSFCGPVATAMDNQITVPVYPVPTVAVTKTAPETFCAPLLSGKITVTATGGTAPYTVKLYKNNELAGESPATSGTHTFTGLSDGKYFISITDGNGCVYYQYTVN